MTIIHTKMVNSLALLLALFFTAGVGFAGTNMEDLITTERPIEDYLERQGTFCLFNDFSGGVYVASRTDPCPAGSGFLFVPPFKNMPGWTDPVEGLGAFVDYVGLANDVTGSLITTFDGKIRETELANGRALVTMILKTEDALIYAIRENAEGLLDFANGPVVFGNLATDVLAGAVPALGKSRFVLRFRNTAPGAPMPDLLQLFFFPERGQRVRALRLTARAKSENPDLEFRMVQVCAPNCDLNFFNREEILIEED